MPQDMTHYDFDRIIDRTQSDSLKWCRYGEALPLWVADMDFPAPEPVRRALAARVDHGIFGYACEPPELREALVAWLARRFGWQVDPSAFVFVPGVVTGFNVACRAVARPGEGVLVQTPVYPPMLAAPANFGLRRDEAPLACGAVGRYEVGLGCPGGRRQGRHPSLSALQPPEPHGSGLHRRRTGAAGRDLPASRPDHLLRRDPRGPRSIRDSAIFPSPL